MSKKTLNEVILSNLIFIRENMIAKGKDTTEIEDQIEKKRKEIEKESKNGKS